MLGISFIGRINRTQYLVKSTIINILSCLTMQPLLTSNSALTRFLEPYKDVLVNPNNLLANSSNQTTATTNNDNPQI